MNDARSASFGGMTRIWRFLNCFGDSRVSFGDEIGNVDEFPIFNHFNQHLSIIKICANPTSILVAIKSKFYIKNIISTTFGVVTSGRGSARLSL